MNVDDLQKLYGICSTNEDESEEDSGEADGTEEENSDSGESDEEEELEYDEEDTQTEGAESRSVGAEMNEERNELDDALDEYGSLALSDENAEQAIYQSSANISIIEDSNNKQGWQGELANPPFDMLVAPCRVNDLTRNAQVRGHIKSKETIMVDIETYKSRKVPVMATETQSCE